jgi:glycosyltransferase
MPSWLYEPRDRPRIALSLGLSQRLYFKDGWDHVPKLLEMVSTLDVEVVATLNADQLAQVERLPDNVRAVDYIPLNQLLPTCSALVHQGGMGTFAAACALNVPQLIIDFDADNGWRVVDGGLATEKHTEATLTSTRVTEAGAGLRLDITLSVDTMRKQLERVLTEPSFAAGAAGLYADTLAAPSPNEVVPVLEKLTAQYRSGTAVAR